MDFRIASTQSMELKDPMGPLQALLWLRVHVPDRTLRLLEHTVNHQASKNLPLTVEWLHEVRAIFQTLQSRTGHKRWRNDDDGDKYDSEEGDRTAKIPRHESVDVVRRNKNQPPRGL